MSALIIPESEWKWGGMPGHLCVASMCCFHLHTRIGRFSVSTVGCYHPPHKRRGEELGEPEEIGCGRLFETMVFDAESGSWTEIDFAPYDTAEAADAGHIEMCRRWAAKPQDAAAEGSAGK